MNEHSIEKREKTLEEEVDVLDIPTEAKHRILSKIEAMNSRMETIQERLEVAIAERERASMESEEQWHRAETFREALVLIATDHRQ